MVHSTPQQSTNKQGAALTKRMASTLFAAALIASAHSFASPSPVTLATAVAAANDEGREEIVQSNNVGSNNSAPKKKNGIAAPPQKAAAGGGGAAANRPPLAVPKAGAAPLPPIVQLHPLSPRLIAIGDVHGDIDNFKAILLHAQLIDCDGNWTGEDATVIQLGDVCDRGPHSHTVMEYIDEVLIPQARAAGGEFVQLLGNHEMLTMRGDHRFTMEENIHVFGGLDSWLLQHSSAGAYGARNAKLDTVVVRNGTAFVHAGLLPEHAEKGVEWVNAEMRSVLTSNNWDHPFASVTSPVWTRDQVYAAMRKQDCTLLRTALRKLSESEVSKGRAPVSRLVVGHTIQPNGAVSVFCDGAFIAADVSSSQYMQGGGHLVFVEFRRKVRVDPATGVQAERLISHFKNKGPFKDLTDQHPLTDKQQLYLQLLNEGDDFMRGGGAEGGGNIHRPSPQLEIVGVPSYPAIPWKRHKIRKALPPKWGNVTSSSSSSDKEKNGSGDDDNDNEDHQSDRKEREKKSNNKFGVDSLKKAFKALQAKAAMKKLAAGDSDGGIGGGVPIAAADGGDDADVAVAKSAAISRRKSQAISPMVIGVLVAFILFVIGMIVSGRAERVRVWIRRANKTDKDRA